MKSRFGLILAFSLLALVLSACGGRPIITQWPAMVAQGEVVYLSEGVHLYTVDAASGLPRTVPGDTRQLRFPAEANTADFAIYTPAAISENLIVVGNAVANKYTLFGLDPATLSVRWTFDGAGDVWMAGAVIENGRVFAPSGDGTLYALNAADGSQIWTFKTERPLWASPVTDGKTVFFGSFDHYVYALDAESGVLRWKVELDAALVAPGALSMDGETLYIGTLGKSLYALNTANGNQRWKQPLKGWVWSAPVVTEDAIYLGTVEGTAGVAYSINPATGQPIWTVALTTSTLAAPLVTDELAIFVTEGGEIRAFDLQGNPKWQASLEAKLYTSPILVGDLLLIAPMEGEIMLAAYNLQGSPRWTFKP
jgi:eukaryotic-like serine/threonine-protein kinase